MTDVPYWVEPQLENVQTDNQSDDATEEVGGRE